MKNIIAASILLSLFIVMVFSLPYIQYWAQSYEASHTAQTVFWAGMIVLVIGLLCWRDNLKRERLEAEEAYLDRVRDKVIDRQELRENAEKALTQDQQAHLYMLNKSPHFKSADSELSEKDKLKKFVHGSIIDVKV